MDKMDTASEGTVELVSVSFESLGISEKIVSNLAKTGIIKPMPCQVDCIPQLLKGWDGIIQASEGSGKILAIVIAMVQQCPKNLNQVYGVVVTPTTYEANQIKKQFERVGGEACRIWVICKDDGDCDEISHLSTKPNFLVATPNQLANFIENCDEEGEKMIDKVRMLVFFNYDRLCTRQYEDDISYVNQDCLPKRKQLVLVTSRVFNPRLLKAMRKTLPGSSGTYFTYNCPMKEPKLENMPEIPEVLRKPLLWRRNLTHRYLSCTSDTKDSCFIEILRSIRDFNYPPDIHSLIIFVADWRESKILSIMLEQLKFPNVLMKNNVEEVSKKNAYARFCNGTNSLNILITTDDGIRGMLVKPVDMVISYSVPMPYEYVNRLGKTGTLFKRGLSIMIVVHSSDLCALVDIEVYIRDSISTVDVDRKSVLDNLVRVRSMRKFAVRNLISKRKLAK